MKIFLLYQCPSIYTHPPSAETEWRNRNRSLPGELLADDLLPNYNFNTRLWYKGDVCKFLPVTSFLLFVFCLSVFFYFTSEIYFGSIFNKARVSSHFFVFSMFLIWIGFLKARFRYTCSVSRAYPYSTKHAYHIFFHHKSIC